MKTVENKYNGNLFTPSETLRVTWGFYSTRQSAGAITMENSLNLLQLCTNTSTTIYPIIVKVSIFVALQQTLTLADNNNNNNNNNNQHQHKHHKQQQRQRQQQRQKKQQQQLQ